MPPRRGRSEATLWLIAVGLLAAPTASAHLVSSGVGPFYDGVAHFFVSPEDLVLVVSLALFAGLAGVGAAKRLVLALPVAWLIGTGLGHRLAGPVPPAFLPAAGILLTGLLVAWNPKVPDSLPATLAVLFGCLHGFGNGCAMAASRTPLLAAVGIATAAGTAALLLSAQATSLRRPWQVIALRVFGSWTAAIGLLALAWRIRPGL